MPSKPPGCGSSRFGREAALCMESSARVPCRQLNQAKTHRYSHRGREPASAWRVSSARQIGVPWLTEIGFVVAVGILIDRR